MVSPYHESKMLLPCNVVTSCVECASVILYLVGIRYYVEQIWLSCISTLRGEHTGSAKGIFSCCFVMRILCSIPCQTLVSCYILMMTVNRRSLKRIRRLTMDIKQMLQNSTLLCRFEYFLMVLPVFHYNILLTTEAWPLIKWGYDSLLLIDMNFRQLKLKHMIQHPASKSAHACP